MNLIHKIKFWRELKRLETRARETPAPSTYVDLAQVYINVGQADRTLEIAEEGLKLFPHSEELRKLRRFAKKSQLNGLIKDLRLRLNKQPAADLYKRLAACYLELGDFGAVHGTCEECLKRFPDESGVYLVLGKARLAVFYKQLAAEEGLEAVRCLERSLELEPENLRAHRLLAEVFYRIGSASQALQHLAVLREHDPEDPEVESMWREARQRGMSPRDDPTLRFQLVERTGSLAYGPITRERRERRRVGDEFEGARIALSEVSMIPGVNKAAYIKGSRALVKGDIKDGKDAFLRVVRVLSKAAHRAARRMDIGNFSKGTLDGDFGRICLCSYGEVVAAVLCSESANMDKVLAELQELVAGTLYIAGGTDQ